MRKLLALAFALFSPGLVIPLAAAEAAAQADEQDTVYDRYKACGLQSVCFLANLYKIDVGLGDLIERATSASKGNSLLELKNLLSSMGLESQYAELSPDAMKEAAKQRPLLVFINKLPLGHFIVMVADQTGAIKCFDPLDVKLHDYASGILDQKEYKCLHLDKQLGEPAEAAQVGVDQKVSDFGQIWIGETAYGTFRIQNQGGVPVRLKNVKTGCSCVAHKFDKSLLLRGETATLSVERHGAKREGVNEAIGVFVNDAPDPIMLKLVGVVRERYRVMPRQTEIPKCYPGDKHKLDLEISTADVKDPLKQDDLKIEVDTLDLDGPLTFQPATDSWKLAVPLAVPKDAKQGDMTARLVVKNTGGPVGVVMIKFSVAGIMEMAPETIMVSPQAKPGDVAGKAVLTFTDGRLRPVAVNAPSTRFAADIASKNEQQGTVEVQVKVNEPLLAGVTQESISITCPDTGETRSLLVIANAPEAGK